MKLVKLLANLGYGSRKEVQRMIRDGLVTDGDGTTLAVKSPVPDEVRVAGEPLDPPAPLFIVLNKPVGFTCSTDDLGETVYDLLPPRYEFRNPILSSVGRLDKDTSGMLLMTDDGKLLHKIIHPKHACGKTYHALLDRSLKGNEAEIFASGTLMLESENKPLLPAELEVLGEKEVRVTLHEGRYHQVRRMFAAVGNHVTELKRVAIGGLELPADLEEGDWRPVTEAERNAIFGEVC